MEADAGIGLTELRVDGGASRNDLLMQTQCDLLGVPVVRSRTSETTALGAAYLAGLSTDVWASREEIAKIWTEEKRFIPNPDSATEDLKSGWRKAIERSKL